MTHRYFAAQTSWAFERTIGVVRQFMLATMG
ncbi:hypothetical protein C4K04_3832 [Pseudomonas chlororaphis]|uniref:Uncharacterized protein n=1 Tax=Pseudomonas chlororaphis TaxID=587753 RepID=A0A3G7TST2_9PSED|nr:hypothetical protein C4K04_3832 [Pseudomonas chlororaphis]